MTTAIDIQIAVQIAARRVEFERARQDMLAAFRPLAAQDPSWAAGEIEGTAAAMLQLLALGEK